MRVQLLKVWEKTANSFWFIPTLLVAASGFLALTLIEVDRQTDSEVVSDLPWLFQGGADSARALLSSIATSTITVVGVVFSVTIVALTLASSQYTPRVLYTFTRDHGNQTVMGIFIGTFTYALIAMRSVRSTDEGGFVPAIAVTGGLVLALISVGALIFFIHHISQSIRASHIITSIGDTTEHLMTSFFPEGVGGALLDAPAMDGRPWRPIEASSSGYVQMVDGDAVIDFARRHDLVVRIPRGPGDYVVRGDGLLEVSPGDGLTDKQCRELRGCIALGHERTMQQDPEFGLRQLMDIAVKALSPSVNDPTTAITCIDRLSSLLRLAAGRDDPPHLRADERGTLRLIARGPTFETLVGHAFDQIRQHGAGNVAVTLRLLRALASIGRAVTSDAQREILWQQACMIAHAAGDRITEEKDRDTFEDAFRALADVLERNPTPVLLRRPSAAST